MHLYLSKDENKVGSNKITSEGFIHLFQSNWPYLTELLLSRYINIFRFELSGRDRMPAPVESQLLYAF